MELKTIAKIHTDFPSKFGLPRQSGLVKELCGTIVFESEYRNPDAVRGLEGYSHLWVIWGFSEAFSNENEKNGWSPTVRPPRLGGNRRMGVFATRSPNRPNRIGLSCVRIQSIEYGVAGAPIIHVSGIDMMNGTPIYDIKPYLPFTDSHTDAVGGFSSEHMDDNLDVDFPNELLKKIPIDKQKTLIEILKQDPRPSYHNDDNREYGFEFAEFEIKFTVHEKTAVVCDIEEIRKHKSNNSIQK